MYVENLGGELAVHEAPPEVIRGLKRKTTLANPLFHKLLKMGRTKALYACPKEFRYWREDKGVLYLGRGMGGPLERGLKVAGISPPRYVQKTVFPKVSEPIRSSIKLRPYQEGLIEKILAYDNGIIRLGTGFGKTVIALELISRLQTTALFIVPRGNLLEQFREEARSLLHRDVGVIQGGTMDVQDITVATWQTLQRRGSQLKDLGGRFGLVIADECHSCVTSQRLAVLRQMQAARFYGLTATARRTDEQGDAIGFTFGDIIVDEDLPQSKPEVITVPYDKPIPLWDYSDIITKQTEDEERNLIIANLIRKETADGRRVICLTKRVSHYERIHAHLTRQAHDGVFSLRSTGSQKERALFLESLRQGRQDYSCLLGTFSLLSTGVDIPSLDTLIIAGDLKSDVLAEQSAGRVLRLFEGKQAPRIIDVYDRRQPILFSQFRARRTFYQENAWPIKER